ncbi:MAG: asparagine synthase (glutamine-hydrolyzing) [Candidatus Omnitrophota bacterium]|nr:MAG: asparagine synthase (glutamine-hydrolyzing) [Candidatus Omnitrophota bacterium]
MCGICGIIDFNRKSTVDAGRIRSMCDEMKHRGPDGEGIYVENSDVSVGLGHRRLSIIDLTKAASQPMSNEDSTLWFVFNGEIYNYRELRQELIGKGHKFKSASDSETLIHLYEEMGEDCIESIRGMFAFAIWDAKKQILFLARDRIGKKPLLYSFNNGVFCFASEFSALLKSGLIKKDINLNAINSYLSYGYIPAPFTIYRSVYKLLPAHTLILKKNQIQTREFWQLNYAKKINISEKEAEVEILRRLKEAVGLRLYSDVALGAFLSGGIDSSSVVALMSELSSEKVKTFSIGFEEKEYSELKYAKNIARKFNTEHHEFIVKPKALEVLPLLVERYGEPYADSSCIPTYYVAQQTKRYVTVALNGDGGDELFAGYERYQGMVAAQLYKSLPKVIKMIISGSCRCLPDSINPKNRFRNIKRFMEAADLKTQYRYFRWMGIFDDSLKNSLYSDNFSNKLDKLGPYQYLLDCFDKNENLDFLDKLLLIDATTVLPNDYLVKVDIAGMSNSLEGRSPFLDHKFMEFAASLPAEYKLRNFVKKYIMKKIIRRFVPKENIFRRKMGFAVPIAAWFRNEMKEFLCETILSERALARGYFKKEVVSTLVKQHLERQKDHAFQLWALLMLELWHKRFID